MRSQSSAKVGSSATKPQPTQAASAPLAPVRLVSLATALEVLVMGEHESLGKRSKLARRVGRIVSEMWPAAPDPLRAADDLYRLRSECLHQGLTQVGEDAVKLAFSFDPLADPPSAM